MIAEPFVGAHPDQGDAMSQTPLSTVTRTRPGLRRPLTAVGVAPVLWVAFVWAGGGLGTGTTPAWVVLVTAAAALGASTAASYLPTTGPAGHLVWGCGPCAVTAAASLPLAGLLLTTGPHQVPTASLAVLLTGFGLVQRLRDPASCPTGAPHPGVGDDRRRPDGPPPL